MKECVVVGYRLINGYRAGKHVRVFVRSSKRWLRADGFGTF
jgi:hypothetical protein